MGFNPLLGADQSVRPIQAAAFIGCSVTTLAKYRKKGMIPAHAAYITPGMTHWRYRLLDLHEFIQKHTVSRGNKFWDPDAKELPMKVVARLLGTTISNVDLARMKGRLRDYSPESVQKYLLRQGERHGNVAMKAKLQTKMEMISHLRKKLKRTMCETCRRKATMRHRGTPLRK